MSKTETLIELIDEYSETRHRCGGIYSAKTEAARKAVIEALSGVQALSAAPGVTSEQRRLIGVIADKIEDGTLFQSGIYPKKDLARFVRNMLDTTPTAPAASPTPPAEQQAAPKAAPGEPRQIGVIRFDEHKHPYAVLETCSDGKGNAWAAETPIYAGLAPQQEAQEPHGWLYEWTHSSATGKPDATYTSFTTDEAHARKHDNCRAIYTAPQPAPQKEAQEPGEIPESIERMATGRYKVVPSHKSMFHRWAVVAGSGTQQLYLGREVECQNMARKFAGAFLDGAFVTMQSTSPNPAPAPLSDDVVKDAARYRWLRINAIGAFRTNDGKGPVSVYHLSKIPAIPGIPEETDAAIDAAMVAQGGKA